MFEKLARPLLFAHRGASLAAPENTLEAFELAYRLGADVFELDVHQSRDGAIVVIHDATLERTTNGHGRVRDHDLGALLELDAGYHHRTSEGELRFRDRDVHIPLLRTVLEAFPKMALNIELKQREPSIVAPVLRLLDGVDPERVVLAAADDAIMAELEAAGSPFPLGLSKGQVLEIVRAAYLGRRIDARYRGRALQIPPRYYGLPLATRRIIRAAHAAGLEVHLWTLDDPRQVARYLRRKADGIISNDAPGLLDLVHPPRESDAMRRKS